VLASGEGGVNGSNPNPFASDAESQIRDATANRIRDLLPYARIIHELNVEHGTVRADVAAVTEDRLYLFEIKSSRDNLHRLPTQLRHFHPVCHGLVVVTDEKWCGAATAAGYPNCDARAIIRHHGGNIPLWQWPEPERVYGRDWTLPATTTVPWHHRMLHLLWTDELRVLARDHSLPVNARFTGRQLCRDIAAAVPGSAIETAVCRALRARAFKWADASMEDAA
jgi:hypothetical protein